MCVKLRCRKHVFGSSFSFTLFVLFTKQKLNSLVAEPGKKLEGRHSLRFAGGIHEKCVE